MSFDEKVTLHPLGFTLELTTNSAAVLQAAFESWSLHDSRYSGEPVRLRMGVGDEASGEGGELRIPTYRAYGSMVAMVADASNFATCNLQQAEAFGWVSPAVVRARGFFRCNYLESAVSILLVARYLTPVHAACVSLQDKGILLCGDSGTGKSSLAFACALRGWTYTTDDSSYLIRGSDDHEVVANPHVIRFRSSAKKLFPQLADEQIVRRLNGEIGIELPTARMPEIKIAARTSVEHIVFLRRQPNAKPRIERLAAGVLRPWLEQVICYGDEDVCAAQRESLSRLLTANLVEMEYSDLNAAVDRLESLVAHGR
jgi:hypothetical protein